MKICRNYNIFPNYFVIFILIKEMLVFIYETGIYPIEIKKKIN